MTRLCDQTLIETYFSAVEYGLDIEFIQLLKVEMDRQIWFSNLNALVTAIKAVLVDGLIYYFFMFELCPGDNFAVGSR